MIRSQHTRKYNASESVVLVLSLLASYSFGSTSNGIVTITAPANGSSVATPVTVTANAVAPPTCPAGIASLLLLSNVRQFAVQSLSEQLQQGLHPQSRLLSQSHSSGVR